VFRTIWLSGALKASGGPGSKAMKNKIKIVSNDYELDNLQEEESQTEPILAKVLNDFVTRPSQDVIQKGEVGVLAGVLVY
jgi:hypothetical protein